MAAEDKNSAAWASYVPKVILGTKFAEGNEVVRSRVQADA